MKKLNIYFIGGTRIKINKATAIFQYKNPSVIPEWFQKEIRNTF